MKSYIEQYLPHQIRKLYNQIYYAVYSGKDSFSVSSMIDMNTIIDVLSRCLLDLPSEFMYRTQVNIEKSFLAQKVHIGKLDFNKTVISHMKNELTSHVDKILSSDSFVSCKNDEERIQFFYKFIQQTTKYDYDEIKTRCNPLAHTSYGAIVNHLSVCDGNAKAMILLCDKVGIKCIGVDGFMNGGEHDWVMVNCNGIWYHTDPTFCYTINDKPDYSHFLQSDNEIMSTHQWERTSYPVCNIKNQCNSSAYDNPAPDYTSHKLNNYHKEDLVCIDSMSTYQMILREFFSKGATNISLQFSMSLGSFKPDMYLKLFERIAVELLERDIAYKYQSDRENRILLINWE